MPPVFTLARMYLKHERGQAYLHAIRGAIFPFALYYLTSRIARTDAEIQLAFCGSISIGLSFGGITLVGNSVLDDRFAGRLKLIQSSGATLFDYLLVQLLQSVLYSGLVIGAACVAFGGARRLALVVPLALGAGIIQASLALWIGFRARTMAMGELLFVLVGLVAPFVSPIFYEPERLPRWLAFALELSPFVAIHRVLMSLLLGAPPVESLLRMAVTAALLALFAVATLGAQARRGAASA